MKRLPLCDFSSGARLRNSQGRTALMRNMLNGRSPLRESGPHLDKTSARAGSTPHVTRYVLSISLVLAVAALAMVLIF